MPDTIQHVVPASSTWKRSLWAARAARSVPLLCLAILLTWVTIETPYQSGLPIRSDGVGYHAWTRALLDGNFSFCAWKDSPEQLVSFVDASGRICQNKYPPGLALLRFPVMAWLVDRAQQPTAISPAEHQASLVLGALALFILTALLVWSTTLLRLSPWRSSAAILLTIFGTGLFHYGTYDSSFTHIYSALFCTLLVTLAIRERIQRRPIPFVALLLSAFFLLSIRLTNVVLLAGLIAAYLYASEKQGTHLMRKRLLHGAPAVAIGAVSAVLIQLFYNYYARGTFTASSYGDEHFLLERPMQAAVLFSYERGLFTYYPVFGVALVGGTCVRAARAWTALLGALVLAYTVLYGYWHAWQLGGGMGHRGFVDLAPLAAIVLAVTLHRLERAPLSAMLVAGSICAVMTLQVMIGYWRGTFPFGGASAEEYVTHLRSIESALTGGTECRPSRCDLLRGRCRKRNARAFTHCSLGFVRAGYCTGTGTCAAVVALKSLASGSRSPYVSAPAFIEEKPRPLIARAQNIGPREKLLIITNPANPSQVFLRSVLTGRYVTVPDDGSALIAKAKSPGEWETFTRVGPDDHVSLRAANMKYVTAPLAGKWPKPLIAGAEGIGEWELFALEPAPP